MKVLLVPDSLQWVLGTWARQAAAREPRHTYYWFTDRLYQRFPAALPALMERVDVVHLLSPRQFERCEIPWSKASVASINHVTDWGVVSKAAAADAVCCMSDQWRRALTARGVSCDRLETVSHGVDAARFAPNLSRRRARARLGLPQSSFLLGCFASASSNEEDRKGMDILADGMRALKGRVPDCGVVVTGTGWDAWSRALRDAGVPVYGYPFLSPRGMPCAYRALNAYVVPARVEGGPVTLLEAMASAVPVIATPVGFVPEEVQTGRNGFVVPGDAAAAGAIADCAFRLSQDPALAVRMGAAARADMLHHRQWANVLKGLGSVYERAAQRRDARVRSSPAAAASAASAGARASAPPGSLLSLRPASQRRACLCADAALWREQLLRAGQRRAAWGLALHAIRAWPLDPHAWRDCRQLLRSGRD